MGLAQHIEQFGLMKWNAWDYRQNIFVNLEGLNNSKNVTLDLINEVLLFIN